MTQHAGSDRSNLGEKKTDQISYMSRSSGCLPRLLQLHFTSLLADAAMGIPLIGSRADCILPS